MPTLIQDIDDGLAVRNLLNDLINRGYNYGPYASLAAAKTAIPLTERYDGLTVRVTGAGDYNWLQADLTDAGLIAKSSVSSLFTARAVYLVADANDVIKMGGAANNVYNTAQAAYNAANVIQTTLGGNNQVIIFVQNTINTESFGNPTTLVGDITLTANWNNKIRLVGISPSVSVIGNIVATNAAGNGYSLTSVHMYNLSVNNITTNATGITGTSGDISLIAHNCKFLNLDSSVTNGANITGNGGNVRLTTLFNLNSAIRVNSIITRSQTSSTVAGTVFIRSINAAPASSSAIVINQIQTAISNLGGEISIDVSGVGVGIVSCVSTAATLAGPFNFSNATLRNVTLTLPAASAGTPQISFNQCNIDDCTISNNGLGVATLEVFFGKCAMRKYTGQASVQVYCQECGFYQNFGFSTTMLTQIGSGSIFSNSSFLMRTNGNPVINGLGTGVKFFSCSIVGGSASMSNAANASAAVNVVFTSKSSSFDTAVTGGVTLI